MGTRNAGFSSLMKRSRANLIEVLGSLRGRWVCCFHSGVQGVHAGLRNLERA